MTTISVPTCGEADFKLLAPYDQDLQSAFQAELGTLQSQIEPNTCDCQDGAQDLGYSQTLRTCTECFATLPNLAHAWGCDTCANVVAPVSFYEQKSATPNKIQQYLSDPTYARSVDTAWSAASNCQRGAVVKSYCIVSASFDLNIPAPPPPPTPTPTPSPPIPTPVPLPPAEDASGLSSGAIAGIVVGIFFFILILISFGVFARMKTLANRLVPNASPLKYTGWRN